MLLLCAYIYETATYAVLKRRVSDREMTVSFPMHRGSQDPTNIRSNVLVISQRERLSLAVATLDSDGDSLRPCEY